MKCAVAGGDLAAGAGLVVASPPNRDETGQNMWQVDNRGTSRRTKEKKETERSGAVWKAESAEFDWVVR